MFYFAYGSCMNTEDLNRTVTAQRIGAASLRHYEFGYRAYGRSRNGGVADIFPSEGNSVEGVLFLVPGTSQLDAREGHPDFYRRIEVVVRREDTNENVEAFTYTVVNKSKIDIAPSEYYAGLIFEGAEILSPAYQNSIRKLTSRLLHKRDI
ncbi:gamma-glutamylcyclotransferase family protein [Alteribacillus sp. HJP-4]|uniref:gamma-glutamylcyclotransferase family protein n=1 Tax=Alteribacillus sp. HJP-4 TaxID=2775394 RepID=UPI0035CCD30F